jgi:hypothetical protein
MKEGGEGAFLNEEPRRKQRGIFMEGRPPCRPRTGRSRSLQEKAPPLGTAAATFCTPQAAEYLP